MKIYLLAVLVGFPFFAWTQPVFSAPVVSASDGALQIPITLTGGHDTEGVDRGRPVILIASALNVPPEVFRKVFTGVKPAGPGQQPQEDQVRKNKQVLMEGLSPYGVTDDRLNEVSNYYRYRRSEGELWKHVEATAYATFRNGVVTGITITNPGSGYSSVPIVTLAGSSKVSLTATLSFGTDLNKNGSIKAISINNSAPTP